MRLSIYLLVIVYLHSIGIINGEQTPHSDPACNPNKRSATKNDAGHEDGYCEIIGTVSPPKHGCLRAAVVDYSRVSGPDCKATVRANLDAFEEIARLARENGAKLIVFPEDGLVMDTVKGIFPCLESIPDPMNLTEDFNPCLQPDRFKQDLTVLTRLSCLAREHGMYLIANYGGKEEVVGAAENATSGKPQKGTFRQGNTQYLMLNTDVIFDPTGRFIRRYRKWNPFSVTEIFAKAPKLEHIYFDTDYGRFGVFTCFDMLFKEPAIELVERYHIDTALFPTWWFDELPILTAVQFQDGWSATNQVNLLASNILKPSLGSIGSSIFSGNNSLYAAPEQYKADKQARKTKVLLGTIQTRRTGQACQKGFDPKVLELDTNVNYDKYKSYHYDLQAGDVIETIGHKIEDSKSVCSGQVCCAVEFKLDQPSGGALEGGKLVLIVRDGPRPGFYQWYEQVCAIATLKTPYNSTDDGKKLKSLEFDPDSAVGFEELIIKATFHTKYVYPATAHSLSRLVNRNQRRVNCNQVETTINAKEGPAYYCELKYLNDKSVPNNIYSFGLYGRVYEKDVRPS